MTPDELREAALGDLDADERAGVERHLAEESRERQEEMLTLLLGFKLASRHKAERSIARLETMRYTNRKSGQPVVTANWDETLRVEPIPTKEATQILAAQATDEENGHYLERKGQHAKGATFAFALKHRLKLGSEWWTIGIVTFARPTATVCKGVAGRDERNVIDCSRLWVERFYSEDPWAADDPKSKPIPGLTCEFLKRAIKQLPPWCLFVTTYADPTVGHTGTHTYGEAGFIYAGQSLDTFIDWVPPGCTGNQRTPGKKAYDQARREGWYRKGMPRGKMIARVSGVPESLLIPKRRCAKHRWLLVRSELHSSGRCSDTAMELRREVRDRWDFFTPRFPFGLNGLCGPGSVTSSPS